jgi:hypothetical protein
VVYDQKAPGLQLLIKMGDRRFRVGSVLEHAQADDGIELLWQEGKMQYVGLSYTMMISGRKILVVCVDR